MGETKASMEKMGEKSCDYTTEGILADTKAKSLSMQKSFASNVKTVAYPAKIKDNTGWKLRPENKGMK